MGNFRPSLIMCLDCQSEFPKTGFPHRCPECGGVYDFAEPLRYAPEARGSERRIWRYRETFPLPPGAKSVTLGEGDTPLVSYQVSGRSGHLEPGTPTVMIACSAGHRDSGVFEAARFGIDRLKEIVPIWKKEVSTNGEFWVEGDYSPTKEDRPT